MPPLQFAPEEGRTEYAQKRYLNETKRLYSGASVSNPCTRQHLEGMKLVLPSKRYPADAILNKACIASDVRLTRVCIVAVLEDRLKDPESKGWLALGRMTLADLANFSWVAAGKIIGERLDPDYDDVLHICH